jgi:hypothetical protein
MPSNQNRASQQRLVATSFHDCESLPTPRDDGDLICLAGNHKKISGSGEPLIYEL